MVDTRLVGIGCPIGGIGRRARLKIEFRKKCWFDPGMGHHRRKMTLIIRIGRRLAVVVSVNGASLEVWPGRTSHQSVAEIV